MSTIAQNLTRIQQAKADIKTAIEAKGVTVPSSATIDTYDDYVSEISGGGGGSSSADTALKGIIDRSITSIDIPSGVTSIGGYAFYSCPSLTSVTIGSGVTTIGDYSFGECRSLTSVTFADGVTSIGGYAFRSCTSLTNITIGSGVTSIGVRTFQNCTSLTSITINAINPPTLANVNAFNSTNDCPIYVPSESVSTYQTTGNWASLASRIQAIPNS